MYNVVNFAVLLYLLIMSFGSAMGNPKDEECFLHTNQSDMLESSQNAVLDLTHIYMDQYYSERTMLSKRIVLQKNERQLISLRTGFNKEANPRTLELYFDGAGVDASIGNYKVQYISDLVETTRTWSCERETMEFGRSSMMTFNQYSAHRQGTFSFFSDRVDIKVIAKDKPIGKTPDLECFGLAFPGVSTSVKGNFAKTVVSINVTQMYFSDNNVCGKWCRPKITKSTTIGLGVGERRVTQFEYKVEGFKHKFTDFNSRNFTIHVLEKKVYVAVAALTNFERMGYKSQWTWSEDWKCQGAVLDIGNHTAVRLDAYKYMITHSRGWQLKEDYLLISVSSAGVTRYTLFEFLTVLALSVLTMLLTSRGHRMEPLATRWDRWT